MGVQLTDLYNLVVAQAESRKKMQNKAFLFICLNLWGGHCLLACPGGTRLAFPLPSSIPFLCVCLYSSCLCVCVKVEWEGGASWVLEQEPMTVFFKLSVRPELYSKYKIIILLINNYPQKSEKQEWILFSMHEMTLSYFSNSFPGQTVPLSVVAKWGEREEQHP